MDELLFETWRSIPGFPGYEASDHGRVRSYRVPGHGLSQIDSGPKTVLKPARKSNGYLFVGLRRDGRTHICMVHRLVMLAFVGECPSGMEVCHRDNDKGNNHLDNLRYDTHAGNYDDRPTTLYPKRIIMIRNLAYLGMPYAEIGRMVDCPVWIISRIVRGETYKSIGGPIQTQDQDDKRDEAIREGRAAGLTRRQLAARYKVSTRTISRICNEVGTYEM